jgi:murein DD-endopeptidase MepM/ murein hydrolase activator NlpD
MKRTLLEEITRIHTLTYGVLSEDLLGKVMEVTSTTGTTENGADPKKADTVKDDLTNFYETLEKAAAGEGITQQEKGSISFKNEVESMQIGLKLLGYELPNYGIDGLFGPETASAVQKFTNDYITSGSTKTQSGTTVNEAVSLVGSSSGLIGKPGQGTHSASGWENNNAWDVAAPVGTDVRSLTNGKVLRVRKGDGTIKKSGVKKIYGDQVKVQNSEGGPDVFYTHIESTVNQGDVLKQGDVIGKIMTLPGMPSHVHVALSYGNLSDYATGLTNATGGSTSGSGGGGTSLNMVKASKEMLLKMIELLKLKNITKEDISKLTNASKVGLRGGGANVSLEGVASTDFNRIIDIIVDNLEGGYYHPDMLQDGRVKDSRYGASGETMFGMDRKAGKTESTAAGREFWALIDAENARQKWPWNYMGGSLAPQLKAKIAEIMKPNFEDYLGRYMSEDARKIVMSDVGLTFNFAYAVWNGPGWFQRFAKVINQKVAEGVTDPKELLRIAVDTRKNWSSSSASANSLIAQGGRKIEKIVSSMA